MDYLAVHFCCERCRQNYVANLFGEEPAESEIVEAVAVTPRKRIMREYPSARVETRVVRRKATGGKTKTRRRRKAA